MEFLILKKSDNFEILFSDTKWMLYSVQTLFEIGIQGPSFKHEKAETTDCPVVLIPSIPKRKR